MALQGEARLCGRERIIYEGRCTSRPRVPCTGAALLRLLVCASCRRADKIEHEIRYAPLAVGLEPSAIQGGARLRGLADYLLKDHQGRIAPAPPVRAQRCCAPLVCASCRRADKIEHEIRYAPLAVGLEPSAIQGGARLCGLADYLLKDHQGRIAPAPPVRLKGGGFAGRLSTVSVPPNARADPSVS